MSVVICWRSCYIIHTYQGECQTFLHTLISHFFCLFVFVISFISFLMSFEKTIAKTKWNLSFKINRQWDNRTSFREISNYKINYYLIISFVFEVFIPFIFNVFPSIIATTYLYSIFGKVCFKWQHFSSIYIRIMGFFEGLF